MNEITKPNDIFVTTLLNPQSSTNDLIQSGYSTDNTSLMTPEQYKETPFVKQAFTDENGVFNDLAFNQAYMNAYNQFDKLDGIKTYNDLNDELVYNDISIFKPVGAKKKTPTYEMMRVKNPMDTSKGIMSIYGEGENSKSMREIAQSSKVFDTETGKWLDYTAEDQGLFGLKYLTRPTLVYAQYDQDETVYDEQLGQYVTHKKGEWKTNEDGKFYCETLGDREVYGKQVVAYSDILTKEDSWLNKVDVFDSDGKNKSVFGTVMKSGLEMAPYLIPGFNVYWGGMTAAFNLAQVMPTFYKIFESIAVGDDSSDLFKAANKAEGYMQKFSDSYSDDAQQSNWDIEKMAPMVADVFGQIYQMRSMAKLSELVKSTSLTEEETRGIRKYMDDHADDIASAIRTGYVKNPEEFMQNVLATSPEWQNVMKKQSELAKKLSLGYMALTSSSDVYQDALDGGYSRRAAGLAALAATAGQYGIMMNDEVGTWFLDKTVGYNEKVNRTVLKQAMKPQLENIKKASEKLVDKETKQEGIGFLAKAIVGTKKAGESIYKALKYGDAQSILGNAGIESIEEMTEEAVMDATKGAFDAMSYFGIGGMHGSFGGWSNVFSEQGLQRYLTDAVGGFVGGALFKINETKMEPWLNGKGIDPETKYSLYHEIANGNTEELIRAAHDLCSHDSKMANTQLKLGDNTISGTVETGMSQSKFVEENLVKQIQYLDSIINGREFGVSDEELVQRAVRSSIVVPMIQDAKIDELISSDYNKRIDDFVEARKAYDEVINKPKAENEQKQKDIDEDIKKKKKAYDDAADRVQELLDGKVGEKYIAEALVYLTGDIRSSLTVMDKYSYAQAVYGKKWSEIPDSGSFSKAQVEKEYKAYIDTKQSRNEIEKLLKMYQMYAGIFSKPFADYGKGRYKDVRKVSLNHALSKFSKFFANSLRLGSAEGDGIRLLMNELTKYAYEQNPQLQGISLENLVEVNDEDIENLIISSIPTFEQDCLKIANALHISIDDVKKGFTASMSEIFSKLPMQQLDSRMINLAINGVYQTLTSKYHQELLKRAEAAGVEPDANFVISELVKDGFAEDGTIDPATIQTEQNLTDLVFKAFSGNVGNDMVVNKSQGITNLDLTGMILAKFLQLQDVIDNELLLNLKKCVINSINYKINSGVFSNLFTRNFAMENDEGGSSFENAINKKKITDSLFSAIESGISSGQRVIDIVNNWINQLSDQYIDTDYLDLEQYKLELREQLIPLISDQIVNGYDSTIGKEIANNPLFDLLRNIAFSISGDGVDVKLFDLLQQEEQSIRRLGTTQYYTEQGLNLERIRNMRKVLNVAKAVITGMETSSDSSLDTKFGVNQQINYYHKKYGGELEGTYEEIDSATATQLREEINILDLKLKFLLDIIEGNSKSLWEKDKLTREQMQKLLLKACSEMTDVAIDGHSLISEKEREIIEDQQKSDEEKLFLVERGIYEHGQEIIKSGKAKDLVQALINKYKSVQSGRPHNTEGFSDQSQIITDDDLFGYMINVLSLNPDEFLAKKSELLEKQKSIDPEHIKVPFYAQELAIRYALGFFNQQHNGGDNNLYRIATNILRNTKTEKNRVIYQYGIFFCNGITGAGKTSLVLRDALAIIRLQYPRLNIYAIAPADRQVEKLVNDLKDGSSKDTQETLDKKIQKRNKQLIMSEIFDTSMIQKLKEDIAQDNKDGYSQYIEIDEESQIIKFKPETISDFISKKLDTQKLKGSVFIIDEITHFDAVDLQLLSEFCTSNGITLLTGGDTLQLGAVIKVGGAEIQHHIDDVRCVLTPRLRESIRTLNVANKENNNTLFTVSRIWEQNVIQNGYPDQGEEEQLLLDLVLGNGIQLKYFETEDRFEGTKFVDLLSDDNSYSEFVKSLKNMKHALDKKKQTDPNAKIGILTTIANGEIADDKLKKAIEEAGIVKEDYVLYSPESLHPQAVQGAEEEFFVISNIDWAGIKDAGRTISQMYTYTSRSHVGTLMSIPKEISGMMKFSNFAVLNNQEYTVPASTEVEKILGQQEEFSKKMLDGRNYAYSKDLTDPTKSVVTVTTELTVESIDEQDEHTEDVENIPPKRIGRSQLLSKDEAEDDSSNTATEGLSRGMNADDMLTLGYGFVKDLSMNMSTTNPEDLIGDSDFNIDSFFSSTYFNPEKVKSIPNREDYIKGYYNLTSLLLNYDFANPTDELKKAIQNDRCIKLFATAMFGTGDVDGIIDSLKDVQTTPVILVEDYRDEYNRNYTAHDYNKEETKLDILLTVGYKVWDKVGNRFRYFSVAGLPKLETVKTRFPDSALSRQVERLYEAAEDALKSSGKEKPTRSAVLRFSDSQVGKIVEQRVPTLKDNDSVNRRWLFDTSGQLIKFDKDIKLLDMLKNGNINVTGSWFITDEKDVNGEYLFIKFLAKHSIGVSPTLSEDEKLAKLHDQFLDENGKLGCRGKYLFKFSPTEADTDTFSRYIIFDQTPDKAIDVIKSVKGKFAQSKYDRTTANEVYHRLSPYSALNLIASIYSNDSLFGKTREEQSKNRLKFLDAWVESIKADNREDQAKAQGVLDAIAEIKKLNNYSKENVMKLLVDLVKNHTVAKGFPRKLGLSFILYGVHGNQERGYYLAQKIQGQSDADFGYLQTKKGKSNISIDVYAGYPLVKTGNEEFVDSETGLVYFNAWDGSITGNSKVIAEEICNHLTTNYVYELPKILINIEGGVEVDTDYFDREKHDDKPVQHIYDWKTIETNDKKQIVSINTSEYNGLIGINIGEQYENKNGTRFEVLGTTSNRGDGKTYYVVREVLDPTHPEKLREPGYVLVTDMNARLGKNYYKRFKSDSGNKFQIGSIIKITHYQTNDGIKEGEIYAVVGGVIGDEYLYYTIKGGKVQPEPHTRKITEAEELGNPMAFEIQTEYKVTQKEDSSEVKYKPVQKGHFAFIKGTKGGKGKKSLSGRPIYVVKIFEKDGTKYVTWIAAKSKKGKNGKTTYSKDGKTEYTSPLSSIHGLTIASKKKLKKSKVIKTFDISKLVSKATQEYLDKQKIAATTDDQSLATLADIIGGGDEEEIEIPVRQKAAAAVEVMEPVAAPVIETVTEPTIASKPTEITTPTETVPESAEPKQMQEETNPVTRAEELKTKMDTHNPNETTTVSDFKKKSADFDYEHNTYFVLPFDANGIEIAGGISKDIFIEALGALAIQSDTAMKNIINHMHYFKGNDVMILRFNGTFDTLEEAINSIEGNMVPVANIESIVNTNDVYMNSEKDAATDASIKSEDWSLRNAISLGGAIMADPIFNNIEKTEILATTPTSQAAEPVRTNSMSQEEINQRRTECEKFLEDNKTEYTVEDLEDVSVDGSFAFFVVDGMIDYQQELIDPLKSIKAKEINDKLTNCN